jgi:hypothetical protein
MAGRPPGAQNKDKPFRDALRMEIAAAGEDQKALRAIARNLIQLAQLPEATALPAIREIGDRLDGKPAQAIVGDNEFDPVQIQEVRRVIVDPRNPDS